MQEFNQQELAQFFQTTLSVIKTNFPTLKQRALKQGYSINKRGKGDTAIYEVERIVPQTIDKNELTTQPKEYWKEDLPNEIWTTCYCDSDYEVSSMGRVRYKKDLSLRKISPQDTYYRKVSIHGKNYRLHRVVFFSFNKDIEPLKEYIIDHIDGQRANNCLNNLRLCSTQQNTKFKLQNRGTFEKELTRLIQNHGYEETLKLLQKLT